MSGISTHAPAQGATGRVTVLPEFPEPISTHAPAQGATDAGSDQDLSKIFQPTLPHRERPRPPRRCPRQCPISTHAPAQGATQIITDPEYSWKISTHAPAQGSDRVYVFHQSLWHISTHAPAQGATLRRQKPPLGEAYFNPRSRTGSDIWTIVTTTLFQIFQPTLPHRERRIPPPQKSRCGGYFNPRSRTGSDVNLRRYMAGEPEISTHAPRTGSDAFNHIFEQSKRHFNPRSRTGSDVQTLRLNIRWILFQPTLPHRERL